jgi:hypothetical protein
LFSSLLISNTFILEIVSNSSEEDDELPRRNNGRPRLLHFKKNIARDDFDYKRYKLQQNICKDRNSEEYLRNKLESPKLCSYGCGAIKFKNESSFCCQKGKIKLALPKINNIVSNLLTDASEKGTHFRTFIRAYNNNLALASIGVRLDERFNNGKSGIYTFRVQGTIYHRVGPLTPFNESQYLQLYIWDGDLQQEIKRRQELCSSLRAEILTELLQYLNENNPHVQTFKMVSRQENIDNLEVRLHLKLGQDRRRYNIPTSNEIAAIWLDDSGQGNGDGITHKHVLAIKKDGSYQKIPYLSGLYDSLAYPLLLTNG